MASANRVFSITELRRTGQGVIEPTLVTFRFDAKTHTAPADSISPQLRVTTSRDEPPGSTDVIEQVISVAWQPFEVHGAWDDKWAGSGYASATLLEFRKLVARASLVRIEFEELSFDGLITDFTFHYLRQTRIEWEFTLSPHRMGDGETRVGVIVQPTSRPTREHVAEAERMAAELASRREAARSIPLKDDSFSILGVNLDSIQANIAAARVSSDRGIEVDAVRQLTSLGSRFRGVRDNAQRTANDLAKLRSDTQVAFDDAIQTLKFDSWTRNTAADTRRLSVRSSEAERDMRAQAAARPRALYRPFAGESLYAIATKFFGSPAAWRAIYSENNLASLVLEGTEELRIPERVS